MVADNAGVLRAGLVKESSCGRVEGGMEKEGGRRPELMMMFLPNPKAIPFKTFPDRVLLLHHSFCSFTARFEFILYLFLYLFYIFKRAFI